MPGAQQLSARTVRWTGRFFLLPVAATVALAGWTVTGCAGSGSDHPIAASSGAASPPAPRAESVSDAVQALSDEGPARVTRGKRSIVVSSASSSIDPIDLARRLDMAVPVATAFWQTAWPQPVVVLAPATLAHWQSLTGLQPDPDVAAVSLGASSAEASAGAASGGQRIVVDPVAYPRLSDAGRSVVLRHEVAHLVSAAHTPPGMPSWLVEGTADVIGFTGSGLPVSRAAEELAALVRRHGSPASLPADADFSGASSSVAYEEGWLACRLIDRGKGAPALRDFYERVAAGVLARPGAISAGQLPSIVDAALRQATGWRLTDFVARWRADLQVELGAAA